MTKFSNTTPKFGLDFEKILEASLRPDSIDLPDVSVIELHNNYWFNSYLLVDDFFSEISFEKCDFGTRTTNIFLTKENCSLEDCRLAKEAAKKYFGALFVNSNDEKVKPKCYEDVRSVKFEVKGDFFFELAVTIRVMPKQNRTKNQ